MQDRDKILERYQVVKSLYEAHYQGREYTIFLVGSRVRGDSTDLSDWDFIIRIPDTEDTLLAPRGRIFVGGECITYIPRRATGFNLFSFASVGYELSAYDVEADNLIVGADDAAFLAARAEAIAKRTSVT